MPVTGGGHRQAGGDHPQQGDHALGQISPSPNSTFRAHAKLARLRHLGGREQYLDNHDHFLALCRRALNQPSLDTLTPALVESWVAERGLQVEHAQERDVGAFNPIKCIVLKLVGGAAACFPKIPPRGDLLWEARHANAERRAGIWEKMEWFSPFWIPNGKVRELLSAVDRAPKERAIEVFNYHT